MGLEGETATYECEQQMNNPHWKKDSDFFTQSLTFCIITVATTDEGHKAKEPSLLRGAVMVIVGQKVKPFLVPGVNLSNGHFSLPQIRPPMDSPDWHYINNTLRV